MPKKKSPRRRKLTKREQKLASKYIAEEVDTRKYKKKQAVAIGINRAKRKLAKRRKTRG